LVNRRAKMKREKDLFKLIENGLTMMEIIWGNQR
jgi:hypothetical protein